MHSNFLVAIFRGPFSQMIDFTKIPVKVLDLTRVLPPSVDPYVIRTYN